MDEASTRQTGAGWQVGLAKWVHDESGVTAIEYGLLAALIAVACIGAISATGVSMNQLYATWAAAVTAAIGAAL